MAASIASRLALLTSPGSLVVGLALVLAATLPLPAQAQITPDATLGDEASRMTPETLVQGDLADLIEGGAIRGGNLFHSFLEFNVDLGQRVYFANPVGIESILSRVTGGDPSSIFGTLGVDGAAALFLINPNGIVFGENASLDIQGSFYATTAAAIPLGEGVYSATAPEQSSLLTVDPSALFSSYLSDASGNIENRGQLAAQGNLTLVGNNLDLQGQVAAGGDLTLLGNVVQIRDTVAVPFVGFAGGDLLVQGNEGVDIVALSHPESGLYAYGDMVLRSGNPVGGDAHYWSGGNFRVANLDGSGGGLYSPVDPIIRASGDVFIEDYQGSSLHVLAGGAVTIGTAEITAPDPGALGIDFLQETIALSDGTIVQIDGAAQPTLDVRAGVNPAVLGTPPLEILTGFDPATDAFFGAAFVTDLPSAADITVGDVVMAAPNGLVLLTNQYEPNPGLEGSIFIDGEGFFGRGIDARGFDGQGGAVYLDARNDVSVINSYVDTSGAGTVGDIVINAGDTVQFERQDRRTVAASNLTAGAVGTGGDIRITATNVEMLNGAQLQASTLGTGDAGNVVIEARDRVVFDNSDALSDVTAGATGAGGNVEITANSLVVINGAQLSASTFGTGDSGNVVITAQDRVVFDGTSINGQFRSAAFSTVEAGAEAAGGNVEITTNSLEVTNGAQLSTNIFGTGDAGNVVIEARDRAVFAGTSTNGQFSSEASSRIEGGATGTGGNIEIFSNSLEVTNGAQLSASTLGNGDAGNVVIQSGDRVVFDGSSANGQFRSAAFSTVEAGAIGAGGNVDITANSLEVTNGAGLTASTRGTGDAGNVVIEARDHVVFDGGNSAAFSTVAAGATGEGGNVVITANSLAVTNGAQLQASTSGSGDAGNVVIEVRDRVVFDGRSADGQLGSNALTTVEAGATGTGGNVVITANSLAVTNGAQLQASTRGNGDAGNVVINGQDRVVFNNGNAFSTVEAGATGVGGNVEISTGSLEVLNGAQLQSSTSGNGNAGNVVIEARDRVSLQGTGSNGQSSGIFTNNTDLATGQSNDIQITAPELRVQEGAVIIASTRNDQPGGNIVLSLGRLGVLSGGQVVTGSLGSGPAGTLQVDATSGIVIAGSDPNFADRAEQIPDTALLFIPQSSLSVRSSATGTAGNIIIGELGTTPRLELNDGGQITAESAAVDGGNIVINLNDLLLLRNGSQISTTAGTAQAGGNGGNITITVPFIIAIPAENSDIAADAFEGAGGNVTITARGIFGIEPRSERTPLSDITASSELGFSGVVTLNTLDTSAIENSLTNLADVVIDTAALTAGSCIARTDESLGSFTVTGSGGLPQRPGDSAISAYPTGTVQTLATPAATHTLLEPDGVYQLPDGRLVLSRACE